MGVLAAVPADAGTVRVLGVSVECAKSALHMRGLLGGDLTVALIVIRWPWSAARTQLRHECRVMRGYMP